MMRVVWAEVKTGSVYLWVWGNCIRFVLFFFPLRRLVMLTSGPVWLGSVCYIHMYSDWLADFLFPFLDKTRHTHTHTPVLSVVRIGLPRPPCRTC